MKYFKKLLVIIIGLFIITGCFKKDTMEDITIYTTIYPIEFITYTLYGEHATIKSIYPSEVDVINYLLTDKQLTDYSKSGLYIYNGLSKEKDYAITMLNKNRNLKIIDGAMNMEYMYGVEELWLDPSNFLMIARNIKKGFEEYITNPYLENEINNKYEKLKIELSELDAELNVIAKEAINNTIIVADDVFLYLTKYGFNVISLGSEEISEKTMADVEELIKNDVIQNIYIRSGTKANEVVSNLVQKGVKLQPLRLGINLTTQERIDKINYIDIMKSNIELLKQELYQ
jgi:zinc transport system substrate-binding protein